MKACFRWMFLVAVCGGAAVFPLAASAECVSGPVAIANHTAAFKGVRYDDPAPGQSTWFYSFTSSTKPAISHVTFALACSDLRILDAGMWNGTNIAGARTSKAGIPEPRPGADAKAKGDPTTGIVGLKFDLGFKDFATHHYYFTVNGNFAQTPMDLALKAGKGFTLGSLCGPAQDCGGNGPVLSSVGDRVWLDADGDGVQDAGESGAAGVTVRLLSSAGDVLATTNTDSSGYYLFDQLVDGAYRIVFVRPAGYLFTVADAGGNDAADRDADPLTGQTGLFSLAPDTHLRTMDAGLVASVAALELGKTGTVDPGTADPWAFCDVFGPAHAFNALVFGDFSAVGGDTDGRLAVGGNANLPSSYSVGHVISGRPIADAFGGATDMFIVGGDLTDGTWGVNGNIVYGGERTGPGRWMSNGNLLRKVSPITFRKDGNVPSDGRGMTFTELREKLVERSGQLAARADRGVVSVNRENFSLGYKLTLEADDAALNVFNLDAAVWNGTSGAIEITAPSNSTVLINVRGENISVTNGSMIVHQVSPERILVHYADAKKVATAGFVHSASVLAMQADATFAGGSIDGRAVFGGSVTTSTGFEFHNHYFTGEICADGGAPAQPPNVAYQFVVRNTGNETLYNVTVSDPLVEVTGGPLTLAPGEVNSNAFSAVLYPTDAQLAAGALTNTATAVAETGAGRTVSATDQHVANLPEITEPPPAPYEPSGGEEKPDFVLQAVDLIPSPSLSGTRFKAQARLANHGLIAGANITLSLWSAHPAYESRPAATPDATTTVAALATGETVVVEFPDLRAPFTNGTFHAMAVVNPAETIAELSYGNNHAGATYTLEPLETGVAPSAEGVWLTWNSVEGYYYFVERAPALDQPFEDMAENVPATPPTNRFLDENPPATPAFYRVWGYKP